MLRRLLLVLVPLLVALFAALAVPLAANIAQRETQTVYLDRLADADRFAALADDALRRNRNQSLAREIATYDRTYGIAVAVYGPDGRPVSGLVSGPGFDAGTPGVRGGLATALAGYRSDHIATVWPWQQASMVVAEPVVRLHADGVYRVSAELDVSGQVIAQMEQRFLVGDPPRTSFSAGQPGRLAQRAEALAEARR